MSKIRQSPAGMGWNMNISKSDFLHLDAALDEALKQSFPASDPIAVNSAAAASYSQEPPVEEAAASLPNPADVPPQHTNT